jgi:hypothetical protein
MNLEAKQATSMKMENQLTQLALATANTKRANQSNQTLNYIRIK